MEPQDLSLVINNGFTCDGLDSYWEALDAAFVFNVTKHREFLVIDKYNSLMHTRKMKTKRQRFGQTRRPSRQQFMKSHSMMNGVKTKTKCKIFSEDTGKMTDFVGTTVTNRVFALPKLGSRK